MTRLPRYGAIHDPEVDALDRSFDAENTYFLEASNKKKTPEQRARQLLSVGLPILIAALIIGGAAAFLTRDFGNLYPGRGGGARRYGGGPQVVSGPDSPSPATSPATSEGSTTSDGGKAACSANESCAKAGLIGDCCPTSLGILLDCCG